MVMVGMLAVDSVKGRTIVWNQLVSDIYKEESEFTFNDINYYGLGVDIPKGHKVFVQGWIKASNPGYFSLWGEYSTSTIGSGQYELLSDLIVRNDMDTGLLIHGAANTSIKTKDIICVDLTLMFGAGNEPTTADEFEKLFPASYYPYCEGRLLSTYDGVKLNQLIQNGDFSKGSYAWGGVGLSISNNEAHITGTANYYSINLQLLFKFNVYSGHKYFIAYKTKGNIGIGTGRIISFESNSTGQFSNNLISSADYVKYSIIGIASSSSNLGDIRIFGQSNVETSYDFYVKNIQVIDLTEMFGAGNEPTTPEAFQKLFPDDYYEYNPTGTWLPVGNSGFNSTGFNQFDESLLISDKWRASNGVEEDYTGRWRSDEYSTCLPNKQYFVKGDGNNQYSAVICWYDVDKNYIDGYNCGLGEVVTSPQNAAYFRMSSALDVDTIVVNLSDPSRNGQYEPYKKDTLDLSFIKDLGIPNFNIWDEQWVNGYWSDNVFYPNQAQVCPKNFIPCLPNTTYFFRRNGHPGTIEAYDSNKQMIAVMGAWSTSNISFTTPENASFLMFYFDGTTYNNDICINKSVPGINGTYLPHGEMYRYFPHGLLSAGSVYDEITPEYVIKRVGVVDMGDLNWAYSEGGGFNPRFNTNLKTAKDCDNSIKGNIVCQKYVTESDATVGGVSGTNKAIAINYIKDVYVVDLDAGTDSSAYKTAMKGQFLYYELETPVKVYFQNTTFNKLKGKTVRWNQLANTVEEGVQEKDGVRYVASGNTITVTGTSSDYHFCGYSIAHSLFTPIGHKILVRLSSQKYRFRCSDEIVNTYEGDSANGLIFTNGLPNLWHVQIGLKKGVTTINEVVHCCITDLTLMFGAGNEPSTPEEFEAMFPDPYYPYTAGSALTTTEWGYNLPGFNQWDEAWEYGTVDSSSGVNVPGYPNRIYSPHFNACAPSTRYYANFIGNTYNDTYVRVFWYGESFNYLGSDIFTDNNTFTSPYNAFYFKLTSEGDNYGREYHNDICINISDTSKNGTYEPYHLTQVTIPMKPRMRFVADGDGMLSNVTGQSWSQKTKENLVKSLKNPSTGEQLFPYGLLKAGEVEDEVTPTYAVKRVGVVDLGTFAWHYFDAEQVFVVNILDGKVTPSAWKNNSYIEAYPRETVVWDYVTNKHHSFGEQVLTGDSAALTIKDIDYTNITSFSEHVDGMYFYYELETPITVTYSNLQEDIPPLLSAPININLSSITT